MRVVTNVDVVKGTGTKIMRFLQSSDIGYRGFGEAYFSIVPCGIERYWKIHTRTTCNIMVPHGSVMFVVAEYDLSSWSFIELGVGQQKRLTIPPMIWYGFLGVGENESIIANIIDTEHQDEENDVEQKELVLNAPKAEVLWKEQTVKYRKSLK